MIKLSVKERYILYDLFEGFFFNAVFCGREADDNVFLQSRKEYLKIDISI